MAEPIKIVSRFMERPRQGLSCKGGRTKQAHAAECDVNKIMSKYARLGTLPQHVGVSQYGDFTQVDDYLGAQLRIKDAQAQFRALPARVRDRFKNNVALFLSFIQDKNNLVEAKELGLLKDEVAVAPPAPIPGAEVVNVK